MLYVPLVEQDPMEMVGIDVWVPSTVLNHQHASTTDWNRYKEAYYEAHKLVNLVRFIAPHIVENPWKQVVVEAAWRREVNRMRSIINMLDSI